MSYNVPINELFITFSRRVWLAENYEVNKGVGCARVGTTEGRQMGIYIPTALREIMRAFARILCFLHNLCYAMARTKVSWLNWTKLLSSHYRSTFLCSPSLFIPYSFIPSLPTYSTSKFFKLLSTTQSSTKSFFIYRREKIE